jgi:Protein of unknown function (DUF3347)
MKKALLLVIVLALALGITYLVLHKTNSTNSNSGEKDQPLAIGSKTSAFNRSFAEVLNSYFQLTDVLAKEDSSGISIAGTKLNKAIDSIRFDQFKADTSVVQTAISLAQAIPGEIEGMKGEKSMDLKKREFNMISADLYSLIRVVRYDGSIIYHMSCATAFSDSSAGDWLSASNTIVNPYKGKSDRANGVKGEECGELKDSLHFSVPVGE